MFAEASAHTRRAPAQCVIRHSHALFTHSEHILSMRLNLTEIIRQSKYALYIYSAVTLTAHHFHFYTYVLLTHLCFNLFFFAAYHMWRWLMVIALINSFPYRTFGPSIDRARLDSRIQRSAPIAERVENHYSRGAFFVYINSMASRAHQPPREAE